MRHRRKILLLALLSLPAAAAAWWIFGRGTPVTAVAPQRGTAVEIVYATGSVEPLRWAKVTSLVRERIVDICDCEGQPVKKGEVLVRLDDREPRAQLKDLKAREDFARREMERASELIARGATSTQVHERVSAELRQIQAQILVQQERINNYAIASPMDGIVLRRDGQVGEIAEVGQVLVRVGVPQPLQVVAEVNEEDIPRVAVGQRALFRTEAFADRRLDGTVREITPMGDPVAKTYRVKIALPDETPLIPGMSVEANIVSREKPDALLVPADAVVDNAVFAVEGSRARKRAVTIGIRGTRMVEIVQGLREDERVASPAPTGLADGARVRILARDPALTR